MSMAMPVLETQRLRIRPPDMADLTDLHRTAVDAGWAEDTPKGLNGIREWLKWATRNHRALANLYQPPYGDRTIIRKADSAFVGQIGIVPTLDRWGVLPYYRDLGIDDAYSFPEMGLFWSIPAAQRGNGYATEAAQAIIDYLFGQLRLKRVIATTENDNEASQRVMRRLGMTLTVNPRLDEMPWLQTIGILENTIINQANTQTQTEESQQ